MNKKPFNNLMIVAAVLMATVGKFNPFGNNSDSVQRGMPYGDYVGIVSKNSRRTKKKRRK